MSVIDHYDIITGLPSSSRQLRKERWPSSMQKAVSWFENRLSKQRSRKKLRELDDHLLIDVGITREQADFEGSKGFFE